MGRANLERLDRALALADWELRQRLQMACVERRRIMETLVRDRGPSRSEQVEAFKSKMGVTPRDHLIVITVR
jgi:hypothetical protein